MMFSDLFDRNVSHEVQRAILNTVMAEYSLTHEEVWGRYDKSEARDVEPHVRRANIEDALIELGDRFYPAVKVKVGKTGRGNSYSYRYLVCGQIVLTQSYVEPNRRVPREATFRNDFAGDPNQAMLFAEDESERVEKLKNAELTYTIVTHTPSVNNPSEPSHVSVILVDEKCRFVDSIDLLEHVRLQSAHSVKEEVIEDRRIPTLRTDNAAKGKQGA